VGIVSPSLLKAHIKKRKTGPNPLIGTALVVSGVILAVGLWRCLVAADFCSPTAFLLTADQQGFLHYRQGDYSEAAQRFGDLAWRAAALYRAGEFKAAAGIYAGTDTAEGAYNHGNALVLQGLYGEAVDRYDRALSLRPGWTAAEANRRLAAARAERLKKEGEDMTGGMLGADEIRFEKRESSGGQTEEAGDSEVQSAEALRAVWLRQVQTRPADFLRAKFAYQQAMQRKTP
jgi:Ca-activated chloride channel family protein